MKTKDVRDRYREAARMKLGAVLADTRVEITVEDFGEVQVLNPSRENVYGEGAFVAVQMWGGAVSHPSIQCCYRFGGPNFDHSSTPDGV